ncbi:MAG: TonB-dependent receptor [Verrucomicrobia bacterium]|nr:TonB-dependent receptor [Verrucomicrobiota bacterium]
MKTSRPFALPLWRAFLLAGLAWWLSVASLLAQTSTGTIRGRVFNPVAQAYVRDAEIRLEGTNRVTYSENDGSFEFQGVPAGSATIIVTFTGYNEERQDFTVASGQVAVREINLTSTAARSVAGKDGVVKMEAFTVSSEREGNAKAIMAQRRDLNITTSVSSDIFGDVTDGNVGEFLKYLPGVDLDYVESEPRGPRLGGMDGQYVGVAFDGMRTASADANRGGGAASRATSFEGFSITSIDSIEINRTASPENDADSPAGTVNMKTKRAFDRKGRAVGYNSSINFNSEEFTLKATDGPRDKKDKKWKPNFQFDYAESFFDRRFGVLLSASRAHSFTEQLTGTDVGYNAAPTAADPRPLVVRQLNFGDGPKYIRKDSLLLTADWKATERLTLSLNMVYSYFDGEYWNRNFTWVAANDNANVNNGRSTVGGDGLTTIIATRAPSGSVNNVATLNVGGGGATKLVYTRQFAPRFEYKYAGWVVDGAFAISRSVNNYEGLERGFATLSEAGGVPSSWIATRPNPQSWEWVIRQTSGNDWFDLRSFTSTDARSGGTRIQNRTELWSTEKWTGTLNARWALPFLQRIPMSVKFGGKWDEETRDHNNWNDESIWSYIGPGGNTVTYNPATEVYTNTSWGSWANVGPEFISPNPFESGRTNALNVININGNPGMPPRASRNAPAELFQQHPELFVNMANVDNIYNSRIANKRHIRQTLTAGYAQVDARLTSRLQMRTGVRMEKTENALREFDPLTAAQMLNSPYASQFTRNATTGIVTPSRSTSISGVLYQYTKQPQVTRVSSYQNYFPSLLFKYNFLPNLEWQAGVNRGISRAPIDNLTGLWVVDEINLRVTSPNPNLKPERHKVYQSRLAYYFGGRSPGQLSVAVIQDEATNFITSQDYTAEQFGIDDPDFSTYTFRSTRNVDTLQRYKNMDWNYNQTLGFLGAEALRGTSVGFTYSRSYANMRRSGVAPHRMTGRLGYAYKRFNSSLGIIWADDKPQGTGTTNYGRYFGAITKMDLTLNFRLHPRATLYIQGRNITNVKDLSYLSPPGVQEGQQGVLRHMEEYGANWVFGLKGYF